MALSRSIGRIENHCSILMPRRIFMPLEDRDIFANICNLFSSQPIEEIMRQYEKAKMLNYKIERRFNAVEAPIPEPADIQLSIIETSAPEIEAPAPDNAIPAEAPKRRRIIAKPAEESPKKPSRQDLVVDPAQAITDDVIKCCVCGAAKKLLSAPHLLKHGLTPAEYRELCGYDPKMPLMSNQRRAKSLTLVQMARDSRTARRNEQEYS